jgi:hypothetical protein
VRKHRRKRGADSRRKRGTVPLFQRLARDPSFKTWKDLPASFLEEASELAADEAIDLVDRLWRLHEHRFLYAAWQLIDRHPSAFRKVRWKMLEPLGNRMDTWGSVEG